ncbi:hypothetical protein H4R26_003715 [Coemansia thaxteri]|uniref:Mitochondrial zinc maintenance protein 1, mitochondrial n=1 Tax=Coemansia thaxteri TaxID=2663907 RepID=A0A9W8BCH5_9FUNG|nr:hypothetical protein H4R26_003715 [Coemansia thaxteri]KAJ2486247.1 hypothetical protein EV174_001215 [Coemansia sp. RSA 2320]
MLASEVRVAYRRLLKIQQRRFAGDPAVIEAAHKQTRTEFEANRSLADEKKIHKSLKHARNVEQVIRSYVVQAPRSEENENTYKIKFTPEHALRNGHPILIKSSLQKDSQKTDKD